LSKSPETQATRKREVPGISRILAISSGKGGVGKSTTSVNIAVSMSKLGKRIGIMDADVFGPSIPKLMNINGKPHTSPDGKTIEPKENYGIQCISIGLMIAEDTPMIWRGPMVMSAVQQLIYDINWNDIDTLIIDMPPGTGDTQLTLAQQVPITGSVIVSTPQDVALIDVKKGLNMFRQVDIPVLGIVENMSYFVCPECNSKLNIFSHGGVEKIAKKMNTEFLGEIPLDVLIRQQSDLGMPITVSHPDSENSARYLEIAKNISHKLDKVQNNPNEPKITME
tara:strand:- start:1301 stop:2143 length:843 start_codon:yes stop_codon:yes gene_type:complete